MLTLLWLLGAGSGLFVFLLEVIECESDIKINGQRLAVSFNLCSAVKTTPIICRSQSLTCLSVWLGRKWIKTIRDAVSLATRRGPISRHYQSNIFPHTGLDWTGSLNTYHYQCGGKLRKLSGYNRLSVSVSGKFPILL